MFIQCNYGSFIGQYGKAAKHTAEILLESHLIHFLGSDTHKHGFIYENFDSIKKRLIEVAKDNTYVENITHNNQLNIINDLDMYVDDYPKEIKEKKKWFSFIF